MGRCLGVLALGAVLCAASPAGAGVVINEILADPPTGLAGDANQDGTGSSTQDEFVELFNLGVDPVDLSGWVLSDAVNPRHTFAEGALLGPQEALVVFGGGSPNLAGVNWQTASSGGLSLNNSGDTVTLRNAQGDVVDQVTYDALANADQSIVRSPEGVGQTWMRHLDLEGVDGESFSPGFLIHPPETKPNPDPVGIPGAGAAAVPEPLTVLSLGAGLPFVLRRRR